MFPGLKRRLSLRVFSVVMCYFPSNSKTFAQPRGELYFDFFSFFFNPAQKGCFGLGEEERGSRVNNCVSFFRQERRRLGVFHHVLGLCCLLLLKRRGGGCVWRWVEAHGAPLCVIGVVGYGEDPQLVVTGQLLSVSPSSATPPKLFCSLVVLPEQPSAPSRHKNTL